MDRKEDSLDDPMRHLRCLGRRANGPLSLADLERVNLAALEPISFTERSENERLLHWLTVVVLTRHMVVCYVRPWMAKGSDVVGYYCIGKLRRKNNEPR